MARLTTNEIARAQRRGPAGPRGPHEVWADYDRDSIVVYQAYDDRIAAAALKARRFVPPFSYGRMTWIKPSFLWLMARSNWGRSAGQTRILAIRIARSSWESALSEAVLTAPDAGLYPDVPTWRRRLKAARVRVQWDPERSLRGAKLQARSIQVGIGRALAETYATEWILELRDLTRIAERARDHLRRGDAAAAQRLLPPERRYPLPEAITRRIAPPRSPRR